MAEAVQRWDYDGTAFGLLVDMLKAPMRRTSTSASWPRHDGRRTQALAVNGWGL